MHFVKVLHIEGQRIEIDDDMELPLIEFGILERLDVDVVFHFLIIGDGAFGPRQTRLDCSGI